MSSSYWSWGKMSDDSETSFTSIPSTKTLDDDVYHKQKRLIHVLGGGLVVSVAMIVALASYVFIQLSNNTTCSSSSHGPITSHELAPLTQNTTRFLPYQMLYMDADNMWTPKLPYLYDQTVVDIEYKIVPLSIFKGNISIVTNVASF